MRITSLAFDPSPRAPRPAGPGIALVVAPIAGRGDRCAFEITCHLAHATLPDGKLGLATSIFLTAVLAVSQRPVTVNVVGERVLFDSDVFDDGAYYVALLRGELDTADGPIGPFLLHASCLQLVSNVVHVH